MRTPTALPATDALYFTSRLLNSLSGLFAYPLTAIEAPMGYGKTMAVREYLRQKTARVAWVSLLTPAEDTFWQDFCRELGKTLPKKPVVADALESLARLGYPYDSVRAEAAQKIFLQLPFARETVLVADNCHLLPSAGFGAFSALLARTGIENLHLVLISRATYLSNQEELRQKGCLTHIGQEAFALRLDEIQKYYAVCGIHIDAGAARALHKTTEGWISALYLYLLRYTKHGVLAQPATISELLEKEIYTPLPPAIKDLLFAVCPLESFSIEQAAYVNASPDVQTARALLQELCRENAFVTHEASSKASGKAGGPGSSGKPDERFAIHSIFREFLNDLFARLPIEQQRAIHTRIGDWFIRQGAIVSGIEAYYAAKDFEKAVAAFERDMNRGLVTSKAAFFVRFFKECPAEILHAHLAAGFKYALAAMAAADFPAFGAQVARLARQCAALPEEDKDADAWRGELEFLYSLLAYNDIAAMSAHHKKANALLGRPTALFGPESPWALGSPSVLFMFHREKGMLREELRLMHECMPHYYQLAAGHGSGGEYLMEAERLYHAGEFSKAAIAAHRAEFMAARHRQLGNVLVALFLHQRLACMAGDFEKAVLFPTQMRDLITDHKDYFLLHTADMCEGALYANLGWPEKIPAWLRNAPVGAAGDQSRLYAFAAGYYYIVHGRALLLAGEYAGVIGMFSHLLETGEFKNHLLFAVYANIYIASAYYGLQQSDNAMEYLKAALNMALPDALYMPFVENSDTLKQLFALPGKESRHKKGFTAIRRLSATWENHKKAMLARHSPTDTPRLTKRERELAHLAATGLQYKSIAEQLHIAPDTVRKALAAVYKKLGLLNRAALQQYFNENKYF